jgi:hypothetical protein
VADGKKKRSLREAFGTVGVPEEKGRSELPSGEGTVRSVVAPESTKSTPADVEKAEKKPAPRKKSRTSPNGNASGGGSRVGARSKDGEDTRDPVNSGNRSGTRGGGRGGVPFGDEGAEGTGEMVPGRGGKMVPAGAPVNMTFTVTAKERYLWTLELKRRGLTAVGVLRATMEAMVGEDDR